MINYSQKYDMSEQNFQPIKIIQHLAKKNSSGNLLVKANSVSWVIGLFRGKLQYAYYSLQSFRTIKNILQRYNFSSTAKTILQKGKNILQQSHKSVFSLVNQLAKENLLTNNQKHILYQEITKEAIEFFSWLTQAKYQWKSSSDSLSSDNITNNVLIGDVSSVFKFLENKLQVWQKFSSLVTSPYQRLVFPNHSLLKQKIPNGTLAPELLVKLAKAMNGSTISEIAIALKQNESRVIQLLLPYLKYKTIVLQPPSSPFDKLPTIPLPSANVTKISSPTFNKVSKSANPINNSSVVTTPITIAPKTQLQSPNLLWLNN